MSEDLSFQYLFMYFLMLVVVVAVMVLMEMIMVIMMVMFISFPVLFGIAENFAFLCYYDLYTYPKHHKSSCTVSFISSMEVLRWWNFKEVWTDSGVADGAFIKD